MILDEILAYKHEELERARRRAPAAELERQARASREPLRGFRKALCEAPAPRVIAEIKRRSPSRGEIRRDFDPVACAEAYASAGAAAISVLTDEHFFGGRLDYLGCVRRAVGLPLLRKDFVVDAYQIDEARVAGADAVLLIAAALSTEALIELRARTLALGMDALVEVHD
ncbi:MAG TPA: indole-3-glycerol phosphate synthase TrpC, partial [Myxococcota bacterium]